MFETRIDIGEMMNYIMGSFMKIMVNELWALDVSFLGILKQHLSFSDTDRASFH